MTQTEVKTAAQVVCDIIDIAQSAYDASSVVDLWLAECRLYDLKLYFYKNRRDYHRDETTAISKSFLMARYHLEFCEANFELRKIW